MPRMLPIYTDHDPRYCTHKCTSRTTPRGRSNDQHSTPSSVHIGPDPATMTLTTDYLPNHTPSFPIDMPCSHEAFQRPPKDTDWHLVAMAVDLSWKSCPSVQAIGRRRPSHIAGRQASLGTASYGLPYPPSLQSSDEVEFLARHFITNPSYLAG